MSNESGNGKYAPRAGNIPGVPINLGGVEFVLAPLGLRLAREFDAKGKALAASEDTTEDDQVRLGLEVILASLQRNYPDITMAELEELIDVANVQEATNAISGLSGLKRVTPGELRPGSR